MTLDPVHVDGIARLAGRVSHGVDADDQGDVAETVWAEFLDPLYDDGRVVLEPIDDQARTRADVEAVALQDPPFETQHGLDSGTINPTTFKNGLVIDVSQAAMAAVPSDLELHRARSIVMTVHSNDDTYVLGEDEWTAVDGGYTRKRALHAPRVDRYEQTVVHALALYLAESAHALTQAEVVEDLLILDGPLYPTGLLAWVERDTGLADLLREDERPRDVVENYVRLVETFVERDVPLVGFVKNSSSKAITNTVRKRSNAPWANDGAFFSRVLAVEDGDGDGGGGGDRRTDVLTFTNWFRSRVGTDAVLSADGDALGIDRDLPAEAYEVTFFVVYDPRDDLTYRIEAPYAFTGDPDTREALQLQVIRDVAAERGPPLSVVKADELAHIDRQAKAQLRDRIEREFEADRHREYDDKRWGVDVETIFE